MPDDHSARTMGMKPEEVSPPSTPQKVRTEEIGRTIRLGILEGKGWIADDFDAPLPEDIQAPFEGRDSEQS